MDLIAAWPWLLAGLIVFMALLALWWWFPQWQLKKLWTRWPSLTPTDFKVLADAEDNFRKTIGQLLAGAAVLVGAGLAYLQFTQQQQNSAEEFRQQQQAAQSLLISNQVAKGFEQLAGEKLEMRLGGIYALERGDEHLRALSQAGSRGAKRIRARADEREGNARDAATRC